MSIFSCSISRKLVGLILATILILTFALGFSFYRLASAKLWQEVGRRAVATVAAGALAIDGDQHETLRQPEDMTSPAYLAIQQQLQAIRQAGEMTFVYTMRRLDDRRHQLIVDADTGADTVPLGYLYPNDQWTHPAYAGETVLRGEPFDDPDFGPLLEAFAPIYNSRGQVVAILGVDVEVATIRREQQAILKWVIFVSLLVAGVLSWVALVLARRIALPIVGVTQAIDSLSSIARGTDPETIEEALAGDPWQQQSAGWLAEKYLQRRDETGSLARAFASMRHQLQDTFRALSSKSEENEAYRQELIAQLEENTQLLGQIRANYLATVQALANAIEAMDAYTEGHCERVAEYAMKIADRVGIDAETRYLLEVAARLHDIGKIAVPTEVLNKAAALTPEEMAIIQRHPQVGYDILQEIPGMEVSREIILQHHENFNGQGYPGGLVADEVVECARILALADSYDAMTSERPYRRQPLSLEEAIAELHANAGTQFDPRLVEVLVAILREEQSNNSPGRDG